MSWKTGEIELCIHLARNSKNDTDFTKFYSSIDNKLPHGEIKSKLGVTVPVPEINGPLSDTSPLNTYYFSIFG